VTGKKKRSIREWVTRKCPNFDPNRHSVLLNGQPVEDKNLDRVLLPFDDVSIKEKEKS